LTTSSNTSNWVRSAILFTHTLAQTLNCAILQLLHSAFRPPHLLRNLADSFFLRESQLNHPPLVLGQVTHEPVECRPVFHRVRCPRRGRGWLPYLIAVRAGHLARRTLPIVRHGVARDPKEPGGKRRAAPFVAVDSFESFAKHVGREVLRRGTVPHA